MTKATNLHFKQIIRLLFLLWLFLPLAVSGQKIIDRIEPPNWWAGMKNPNVQLMVHGNNISSLTPTIKYQGIKIVQVQKTDNVNYLFIDLEINPKTKPGIVLIDFYQGRSLLEQRTWELSARESNSATREGFDNSDVIYLITPDRFANGDPSNDEVAGLREKPNRSDKGSRHGGDIAGVQQHLDYIKDMGFTAIWMMPVLENDMQRSSYHGYSTTDYYKVDPRFGTNESFRNLVQTSRRMGLKHILDVIPNHCGSEHLWMNDLPAKDWINKWDTYTQTNHRKSIANDPYASDYDSRHFTDGWFVRSMPDLNQRNPLLSTYLTQNAIWWIEYLGLAGLRIDTYPYSDPEFLRTYCKSILAEYPNLNIVGEQWHPDPAFVAYWQKGVVNANGYESELPCMMDFPLQRAMIRDLNSTTTWDQWVNVYETLALDALYADPYNIMIFPDNHDMSRIFTQVNEDYNLYRMALVLLATTRGIPQFFYGTEILMKNPGTDEHTVIRSDFPGGWTDDKVNGFTSAGLTDQEKDAQQFVRTLLNWRKNNEVIHTGKLMHFAPVKGVYVYFRYNDAKKVMVILNANKGPHELSLAPYREMLKGFSVGRDIFSEKECALGDTLMMEGAGPVILELIH